MDDAWWLEMAYEDSFDAFLEQEMSYSEVQTTEEEPSDYIPQGSIAPIPPLWHSPNEKCNGICLMGYEVGVPEFRGVAYAHPECALHSAAAYYDHLMDQYDNEQEMSYADAMAEAEEIGTDEGGWGVE